MATASPAAPLWVHGVAYDGRRFAQAHPGGASFVALFCGRDASTAFATYHRRPFPHGRMTQYRVAGSAQCAQPPATSACGSGDDPEYLELCQQVNAFLQQTGRGRGFAPDSYYAKAFLIMAAAIYVEQRVVSTPTFTSAALLGALFALIGLNIQHDANHGAISAKPWVNTLLGFCQDWIGGNSLLWLQQHTVIHHTAANDIDDDTDMMDNPLLRFSPLRRRHLWSAFQNMYFLLLAAGYALKVIVADWYNMLLNSYEGVPISSAVPGWRWWFSIAARLLWLLRLVVLPAKLHGFTTWAPYLITIAVVGGFYLAFFFLLSHNFTGVYHVVDGHLVSALDPTGEKAPRAATLLRHQVMTACNVGGWLLAEINGGLNYQIEHHLFPRLHHSHYAAVAPIVRAYCAQKNIPYVHFTTVAASFASTTEYLARQGRTAQIVLHEKQ